MIILTIAWLLLPLIVGFVIYLLPRFDWFLAFGTTLVSFAYATFVFQQPEPILLELLDNFGVTLIADEQSAFFILTNAFVCVGVLLYCWRSNKTAFFYTQLVILQGSINSVFICADWLSIYVCIEVMTIAAFLLISYPRSDRAVWIGLRYLFVSNVVMLFYLVGAILVYKSNNSFALAGLINAPPEAIALIFLALLGKGGIFLPGFWLPLTHSESETPVSAILSGVVVKTAAFPLVRCALTLEEIDPIIRFFGVATALLGVGYAVFEKDIKRMLALSTISQLGFVLVAPEVGGLYALNHGLAKSALFLIGGNLPSRNLKELQHKPMANSLWIALSLASLSICGCPLLAGFGAKVLTLKNLIPWQMLGMSFAALGTATVYGKFIFLPHERSEEGTQKLSIGFWLAAIILIGGLIGANAFSYQTYTLENMAKPLVTIALGWLAYFIIFRNLTVKLPQTLETLDHLIGMMSVMLLFLLWRIWQ